jgi:cell division protein FtsB
VKNRKEILQKTLQNKYWIILVFFCIWMFFFDTNSIITHLQLNEEFNDLEKEKKIIKESISREKKEYNMLKKHPSMVEKLARERYYFKKENEDVFIIETQKKKNE